MSPWIVYSGTFCTDGSIFLGGSKNIFPRSMRSNYQVNWPPSKIFVFFLKREGSIDLVFEVCLFFCADWLFDRWMFLLHPIDIEVYPPHPDTFSNRMRVTRIHFQSYPGDPDTWPPGYNLEGLEIVSAYPQDRRLPPLPQKVRQTLILTLRLSVPLIPPHLFFSPISVNNHKREFLFSWKRFKKQEMFFD